VSVGVKFKVHVWDEDRVTSDDDVDSFVQLLNPSPASSVSQATWSRIVMNGTRRSDQTRYLSVANLRYFRGMTLGTRRELRGEFYAFAN